MTSDDLRWWAETLTSYLDSYPWWQSVGVGGKTLYLYVSQFDAAQAMLVSHGAIRVTTQRWVFTWPDCPFRIQLRRSGRIRPA